MVSVDKCQNYRTSHNYMSRIKCQRSSVSRAQPGTGTTNPDLVPTEVHWSRPKTKKGNTDRQTGCLHQKTWQPGRLVHFIRYGGEHSWQDTVVLPTGMGQGKLYLVSEDWKKSNSKRNLIVQRHSQPPSSSSVRSLRTAPFQYRHCVACFPESAHSSWVPYSSSTNIVQTPTSLQAGWWVIELAGNAGGR